MDNQDQRRTQTQGHESHGVHVCKCRKCGWPFPNPHPSAKHRRAHKKICGTVEGYKMLVSESQTCSDASDDEHLSDEDRKTQGPNALDTGNNEKCSGGIGEELIRSGDEVFSDAIANFSDGGLSPGIKEPLRDSLDSATNVEIVDIKYPEFSGYSSKGHDFNAADDGQMHDPHILQSERVEDGPLSSSITDLRTEESNFAQSDDCFALSSDSNPSKTEATSDVLLDKKIYAGENVRDYSLTSVAKDTNSKGKDEIKSDSDMVEIVVSSHNTLVETCEGGPRIAVSDEVNSDCQVAGGAFNLKEMNNAEFLTEIPQDDLPLEVNSTASTDTSTIGVQVESALMRQCPTSSDVKTLQEWREGNVDVFTLPSCNVGPDVAHPQNEYEDFKDHEGVSSQNSLSLHSSESLKQKQDDLKDSVSEENNFLINQSQLSEKRELLSPDVQVLHGSMKEQVNCEVVAENMHAEESIEISYVKFMVESDKRSDEIGASINAMKTEINESYMVPLSEEINDVAVDGKCRGSNIENDIGISMKTLQPSNLHLEVKPSSGLYKSDDAIEMDKIEKCDKTDAQSTERPIVKDSSLPKSASSPQEDIKDDEIDSNDRVNEECNRFVGTCSAQCVSVVEDTQDEEPGREASGITDVHVQDQSGTNEFKLASSAIYSSVDSSSRCDSLEGNWGSVSVSAVSMQSDVQANIDAEGLPSNDLLVSTDAGKSNLKDAKVASESQQCEKPEMFEPPSFMTLVEPGHVIGQNTAESEVEKGLNQQNTSSTSSQAGWFPTLTQVTNESQGRKRNEEIIAKVTNWSNNKQHTSLKSVLAEASHSNKPKSPKLEDIDSGLKTVKSIPGPESPAAQTVKEEGGKEWNSPARYPADMKREKKKAKSRPYWIQFVCCSSVDPQRR